MSGVGEGIDGQDCYESKILKLGDRYMELHILHYCLRVFL